MWEPTPPRGGEPASIWQMLWRQLRYLILGTAPWKRLGRWVWNHRDKVWRYYLDDQVVAY